MEELLKAIDTKRELLRVTRENIGKALDKKNATSVERQKKTIEKTVQEIYEIKVKIQELKIQSGEDIEETTQWASKIDQELEICDEEVPTVNNKITEWKRDENEKAKQAEEQIAGKLREELFREQLQFDKAKHEQKVEHERELEELRKAQEKADFKRKATEISNYEVQWDNNGLDAVLEPV